MNSKTSPSLIQMSRKTRLTGEDCGRALLICTADSALTGVPTPLPQNIADYINTVIPYNAEAACTYGLYLKLCNHLSHQRALADAHSIRLFAHLSSMLKTLETSFAVEHALACLADPGAAEAAYSTPAPFVGYGIEAFIQQLYDDSAVIIEGTLADAVNFAASVRVVAAYNLSIRLIAQETRVKLDALLIDTTPIEEKTRLYNRSVSLLNDLIERSKTTQMKSEKLQVLEKYFGQIAPISEAVIPEKNVIRAAEALKDLKIFETGVTPVDILLEDDSHA